MDPVGILLGLSIIATILVLIVNVGGFRHRTIISAVSIIVIATFALSSGISYRALLGTPKTSIHEGSYEVVEYNGGFVGKQQPCYYFLLKEKTYDSFYALPTFYAIPADSIKISPAEDFTKVNTLEVVKRNGTKVITLFLP